MAKRRAPEVNAGSMADIAFLLLIFFLVTTTIETDRGISRKLPPIQDDQPETIRKEKNIFIVIINKNGKLLVEDKPMQIGELRDAAVAFIDNGAGTGPQACTYCQGKQDPESSDNPGKAVISVQNDRQTKYGKYIAVQNELVAAFNQLRNRAANRLYGESFVAMEKNFKDAGYNGNKKELKKKIKKIRELYPLNISEAEPEEN